MNCASNAFALYYTNDAIQMIFLKYFVVCVTRLTNCLTESFRNINSYQRHRTDISAHRFANLLCDAKNWNENLYVFDSFTRLCHFILSRFEIIELFCIYNLLYLQTHSRPCV